MSIGASSLVVSLRLIPLGLAWPAAFAVALTLRRTHKNDGISR